MKPSKLPSMGRPGVGQPCKLREKRNMWNTGSIDLATFPLGRTNGRSGSRRRRRAPFRVVALRFRHQAKYFCGCWWTITCEVAVVPAQTTAEEVLGMGADGVFLSNGPRRSRAGGLCLGKYSQANRAHPGIRHLSRPPTVRSRARRKKPSS